MLVPPKSSILIGFSIINHPFWGTPFYGNTQICITKNCPTKNESPRHWSKLSRLGPGDLSLTGQYAYSTCEICIVLRSLKTLISQVGSWHGFAILSTTAGLLKILKSVRFASFEHHTTTFKLHDIGTYRNEKGFHIFKCVSHLRGIFVKTEKEQQNRQPPFTNIVKVNHLLFGEVSRKDLTTTMLEWICIMVLHFAGWFFDNFFMMELLIELINCFGPYPTEDAGRWPATRKAAAFRSASSIVK